MALTAGFLSSCKQPEVYNPEVTFSKPAGTTLEVFVGDSYTFEGKVTVAVEVTLTDVRFFIGADELTEEAKELTGGETSYDFTVKVKDIQEDFTFSVKSSSSDGGMGENQVEVTVTARPLVEKNVVLGHFSESEGEFVDLETGSVYGSTGTDGHGAGTAKPNQAVVDILFNNKTNGDYKAVFFSPYYYKANIGTELAEIGTWTTANQTKFKKGVAADYDAATWASVEAANPSEDYVKELANGDVVFFKTVGGKYGVIKVENIVNPSKSADAVTFKYKIQAEPATK